jgi:DNA-binding transcriptional LysR family regulator
MSRKDLLGIAATPESIMTLKRNQRLDIDALRALCAIEGHGGITRAAESLGLTQSAVSYKVKRLETSLDCDILSRRPNAPLFTDAGKHLLGFAKRILGIHDEALLSLTKTPLQGKISLGMTEDTTCSDLSRILGRFQHLHPAVSVRAHVRQSLTLQSLLATGEIDIAVLQVFKHEIRPSDTVLFEDRLHWVKSPDLSIGVSGSVPYLSFDENCFYRRWATDIGQENGAIFETVLECDSAAGIVAGVNAGLGVALLGGRHVTRAMHIIDDLFPTPPDVAYVVRVARRARNLAVESLVREIKREVNRQGALRIA